MRYTPPMHGLKQQRQAHNWSKQQLAERVGVDRRRISDWENGRRLPKQQQRQLLLQALGDKALDLPDPGCALQPRDYRRLTGPAPGTLQTDTGRTWADLEAKAPDWIAQKAKTLDIPPWFKKQHRADVGLEAASYILLCAFGFTACLASIALLGFTAHPIATESLQGLGCDAKACFHLVRDGREALIWTQVSLCCGTTVQRVDLLVAVIHRGKPYWVAIEVDGSSHHGREQWDLEKESRLRIRTLRFSSKSILNGQFAQQLWTQLLQLTE